MEVRDVDWQSVRLRAPLDAIPGDLPGRWWVAHVRPRCEKVLARELLVRDVPAYLPLRQKATRSRRTGRRSWSLTPVFTGYVFFNGTDEQRVRALSTNRIVTVLSVTDQASLVRQLRDIQTVLARSSDIECGPTVAVGEWVRVLDGPFAGVVGRVRRTQGRCRLTIDVDILAQSVSVEVARDIVEPLGLRPQFGEPGASYAGT